MKNTKFPYKLFSVIVVGVILLFLSLSVPQTGAYLKDTDAKPTANQVGDYRIEVNDTGDNNKLHLPNGETKNRSIDVENRGDNNLFLRVLVHPMLEDKDHIQKPVSVEDSIEDMNTTDWFYGGDGYYYYKKKVLPREKTTNVFTKLKGSKNAESDDWFRLFIKAEAITSSKTTYRDAWWNGKIPTSVTSNDLLKVDNQLKGQVD